MTRMEDSKIISLFFERSEQALEELDSKYGHAVKKTASNILNDRLDVEECINDTYMRCWNSIPPHHPNPLISYVCRITRNLAVNRYHANRAEKRSGNYDLILDELEESIPSHMDVESETEAKELTAVVNRFLTGLSREDRIPFVRRYFYADTVTELAAQTGVSANRVSVRLFRLRSKLKKALAKEGYPV